MTLEAAGAAILEEMQYRLRGTDAENTSKRRGVPRAVKRGLLSAFILLVLILAGGVMYVWFTGGEAAPVKTETAPAPPAPVAIRPKPVAANQPESAAVETITSPVTPGSNVSVYVRTLPQSLCTITVTYGATTSKDSGLAPKHADAYGTVTWTWTVEPSVPVGDWPVHIICAYNAKTAVVDTKLTVSHTASQ